MLRKVYEGYFSVGYLTTIMALPLYTLLLYDYGVKSLSKAKAPKETFCAFFAQMFKVHTFIFYSINNVLRGYDLLRPPSSTYSSSSQLLQ